MDNVTFSAPGKGPWELETTHFSRPFARFSGSEIVKTFPQGFAEGMARYGLLLDHLKPALVNGFMYMQPVAYLAPKGATGPPPAPILWLLTRLHPKMRARIATRSSAVSTSGLPVSPAVQPLGRVLHRVGVGVLDLLRDVDPVIECITVVVDGVLARVFGRRRASRARALRAPRPVRPRRRASSSACG